jgi:DNA-binding transcriptional MerR regulator
MTKPLTIGEAINVLKDEFPDITVSKLRFLETEGLIDPDRSASGYRVFRPTDLERIRYVLRQQRDHFLPLKVIRAKLAAWERGAEPTIAEPSGPPPETYFASTGARMTGEEAARAAGAPVDLLQSLLEQGVLTPSAGDEEGPLFDDDDLAVLRAAHRLTAHGLEPRHLRTFRTAANREADLFAQLTGALLRHRSPASHQQAAEVLADCAQAARDLQDALVRSQLRALLDG